MSITNEYTNYLINKLLDRLVGWLYCRVDSTAQHLLKLILIGDFLSETITSKTMKSN